MTRTTQTGPAFYVYEHWRPDKDVCFYVGKGHGNRARHFKRSRNRHYKSILKKLTALGMCVEVRMVQSGLTEREALDCEIERIAFWSGVDVRLTNLTYGGEGVSGLQHSESTKEVLRQKRALQKIEMTEETKRKISEAQKGRKRGKNPKHSARLKGRKHSLEHRQAISRGLEGRRHSEETRVKIGIAHKGRKHDEKSRRNMSLAHLGKKPSAETRAKISEANKRRYASIKEDIQ